MNWMMITATGLIHTGFVYYLFFDSLRDLSTRMISVLVFLDPAVAILLDTVFTGFRPTSMQVVGIVLICRNGANFSQGNREGIIDEGKC